MKFCEAAGYEVKDVKKFVAWLDEYLIMAKDALDGYDGMSDTQYVPIDAKNFLECMDAHVAHHPDDDETVWTDEFCPICELERIAE